jgi:hypothetical protein
MAGAHDRFRSLGFFDATIGIRVLCGPGDHADGEGRSERLFVLEFEVFECTRVQETASFAPFHVDFVLEGSVEAWRDMIENVRANGGADVAHSINTLTHFGEKLTLRYDDPDGHDKLYRFAESVQQFFDLASTLDDVTYERAPRCAAPAA